jgi:DNA-binding CsgD family transcriptional regulator
MSSSSTVSGTIVIQDRSRVFRESLSYLLEQPPHGFIAHVLGDSGSLTDVVRTSGAIACVFEAADVPWDVSDVVDRLRTDPVVRLVGTIPQEQRRADSIEGVHLVRRTATIEEFMAALTGDGEWAHDEWYPYLRSTQELANALSKRELQVLALISGGATSARIGERLRISPKTVENHRQAIYTKLDVQSQSHAVSVAMRSGLLGHATGVDDR